MDPFKNFQEIIIYNTNFTGKFLAYKHVFFKAFLLCNFCEKIIQENLISDELLPTQSKLDNKISIDNENKTTSSTDKTNNSANSNEAEPIIIIDKPMQIPSVPTIIVEEGQNLEPPPLRNYASKECNAKVLFANEEAENKGAVLNDKERDDYMRNPCQRAQHKFLIIELCENIQVF